MAIDLYCVCKILTQCSSSVFLVIPVQCLPSAFRQVKAIHTFPQQLRHKAPAGMFSSFKLSALAFSLHMKHFSQIYPKMPSFLIDSSPLDGTLQ